MADRVRIPGSRDLMFDGRGQVNPRWRRFFEEVSGVGATPGDVLTGTGGGGQFLPGTDVLEESMAQAMRVDFIDDTPGAGQTTIYKGFAAAGSADAAAVWRLSKLILDTDDDVTTTFADGNTDYDNIWNNRASLTYL